MFACASGERDTQRAVTMCLGMFMYFRRCVKGKVVIENVVRICERGLAKQSVT